MTWQALLPIVAGIVGAGLAGFLADRSIKRRGLTVKDELTAFISGRAREIAFYVILVVTAILWAGDVWTHAVPPSASDTSPFSPFQSAIVASPYTRILVTGFLAWVLATAYLQWRTGTLTDPHNSAIWSVLAVLLLLLGFLPVSWAATAQFVLAVVGMITYAVVMRRKRSD